ncbi:MAG: MarR family transcriptional regulator [Alphaproteobacteria bacterium]|nr:MarR family transcriptional regulator [Alphaproteobacteria bacterium]
MPSDKIENTVPLLSAFFTEIGIIEQLSRAALERVLPDGMKQPHFGVLNHMVRLGLDESPAQLASAFQVTRPTMTNTIQKLEAKGYVVVKPDPRDGRAKIVQITDKGRAAREAGLAALGPLMQPLYETLGKDLFEELTPKLSRVRTYMDENR